MEIRRLSSNLNVVLVGSYRYTCSSNCSTVCQRSSNPFYIVTYYMRWVFLNTLISNPTDCNKRIIALQKEKSIYYNYMFNSRLDKDVRLFCVQEVIRSQLNDK